MTDLAVRPARGAARPGWRPFAHATLILAALALWALSLRDIDLDRMTGYGLVSVLPPAYFVALATLCFGFAVGLSRHLDPRALLAYPLAFVVATQATVPLVFDAPRFPTVYKHLAVIRYIGEYGGVDTSVDVYHNWPGLFAASAMLSRLTGLDPSSYADWAQVVFAFLSALAVCFLARSLTSDARRVAATVWLYTLLAWLGPTYLAPQSLAFFLAVLVLGVVIRWLPARSGDLGERVSRAIDTHRPVSQRAAVTAVLLFGGAVVVSHQLTPYFLVTGLVALFLLGRSRSWVLPVVLTAMTVAWYLQAYDYVSAHFSLFEFDPFGNVQGTQARLPSAGSVEHQWVGRASRAASALALGLAVLGWWCGPPGDRDTFVWGLVLAAVTVLLVQSYGGEAIYRVFIFALPWLCFLGARFLIVITRSWRRGVVLVSLLGGCAAALYLLSYFGLDQSNHVRPQEVRASTWFERSTPPGSVLATLVPNWPTPVTARYTEHLDRWNNWGPGVLDDPRFVGRALGPADLPAVVEAVGENTEGPVYLAVGPTQIATSDGYGYAPPGAAAAFARVLLADPRVRLVHADGDALVFLVRS